MTSSYLPLHTDLSFEEHQQLAKAASSDTKKEIRRLLSDHIDRTRRIYTKENAKSA